MWYSTSLSFSRHFIYITLLLLTKSLTNKQDYCVVVSQLLTNDHLLEWHLYYIRFASVVPDTRREGTAAAAPPPFRPGNPALCGSRPLVTPYNCRLGDLLCLFVYAVFVCCFVCVCVHMCKWLSLFQIICRVFYAVFTARCTLVQSAVLRSHVVCPSVCDVGGLWSHRLEFFEINFTIS